MKNRKSQGLSLIELIIVIGILFTLIAIASVGLIPVRNSTSIDTAITTFTANLRAQQIKSMTGDAEGRSFHEPYGVYMNGSDYILFNGIGYIENEPTNFQSTLGNNLIFTSVTFPSSAIVFATKSGEIINYSSTVNQIVIRDTVTNEEKTITINNLGVVTSIE